MKNLKQIKKSLPAGIQPVIFYCVIQLILLIILLGYGHLGYLAWYCYQVPLLYAFSFWVKKPQITFGLMHVGLLFQASWILDLWMHLAGKNLTSQADFMFDNTPLALKISSLIVHVVVPASTIAWTYWIKPRWTSLIVSAVYIPILYLLSLFFTPVKENINCVFSACTLLIPQWRYVILWPMYLFFIAGFTYSMHLWIFNLKKKRV